ncbi:hypothetical protein P4S64_13800 [Vibrio sp. M60_M31a]
MSKAYLHCLSHTPLVGHLIPQEVINEVNSVIAGAKKRIDEFDPELVILFSPDHYNGFFYDVMPSFCIGMAAHAIGDFGTLAGPLNVPQDLAEECAQYVLAKGVDAAVSYNMQVDHGFAQPLEFLLGSLDRVSESSACRSTVLRPQCPVKPASAAQLGVKQSVNTPRA